MKEEHLIFIVSQPRSGSTLLQALLSNNEFVGTVSEPWLLLPFLSYTRNDLISAVYSSSAAKESILDFKEKIGKESFDKDLAHFLLKQYGKILEKKETFVLDKTPRYYEILDEISYLFPKAKIIVLKRNPMAVLASIIESWGDDLSFDFLYKYNRDFLNAPKLLHDFSLKHQNNPNVLTIQYEHIIEDSKSLVKTVYDWIGIAYNDQVLNYSNNDKYKGQMGDEKGIHKSSVPNAKSLDKWKNVYQQKEWTPFFEGYKSYLTPTFLKDYGYSENEINARDTKMFNLFLEKATCGFEADRVHKKKFLKFYLYKKLFKIFNKKSII